MFLLLQVLKTMFRITMLGLKQGGLQARSRSNEYFLVTAVIALPLITTAATYEVLETTAMFNSLPELQ